MNDILRNILQVSKDVAIAGASTVIPGGPLILSGVQKLLDNDNPQNASSITEIGTGLITAIQAIPSKDIKDLNLINSGLAKLQDAVMDLKHGLK